MEHPEIIQVCYAIADGLLWCNAVRRWGELRENPSGKGYKFPCAGARLKPSKKKKEVKGETATPLIKEVAVSHTI